MAPDARVPPSAPADARDPRRRDAVVRIVRQVIDPAPVRAAAAKNDRNGATGPVAPKS